MRRAVLSAVVLVTLAERVSAQCQQTDWACFVDQTPSRLVADPAVGLDNADEKDYAWGDVDQDGDIDLVAVYKQPGTTSGERRNVLFMNEDGVLVDRTLEYGSASTVMLPGGNLSQGLLDPTNDRDVALVDLTGDGWLDIVTATSMGGASGGTVGVKALSHPRVYVNQGDSPPGSGIWQGFVFDDVDRVPTMPAEPRFLSVSPGDVDGDQDLDLYFTDTQFAGARPVDLNDRLWINDGAGYFSDETVTRMTAQMVDSVYPPCSFMLDMNGDGKLDIVKTEDAGPPVGVFISYNDAGQILHGAFDVFESVYGGAALCVNSVDLNNDDLPDILVTDKGTDRYLRNIGNGPDGLADFAPAVNLGPGLDHGKGNSVAADFDGDGWKDVTVATEDADFILCDHASRIYHHQADPPIVTLADEGNAGIAQADLEGLYDIAAFDINGDQFPDLVLGSCTGTRVYINQTAGVLFNLQGYPGEIVDPGVPLAMQVQLTVTGVATGIVDGSVVLHYSTNGGPFGFVQLAPVGPETFEFDLPPLQCPGVHRFYLSALAEGSELVFTDPPGAPANTHLIMAGLPLDAIDEGFEGETAMWTVLSDPSLSSGEWEAAVPVGSIAGGLLAAPFEDAEPDPGTMAFVTGNCPELPCFASAFDVDGGPTDLLSPLISMNGIDGLVSYSAWFFSNDEAGDDVLTTWVTNEGLLSDPQWQLVHTITAGDSDLATTWTNRSFWIGDYLPASGHVRVRFSVEDTGQANVVEAGIDAFRVSRVVCPPCCDPCALPGDCADLDDNGVRDDSCAWWTCSGGSCQGLPAAFADLGGAFGACAPDGVADTNDRFHALNCFADSTTAGTAGYPCEAGPPQAFNVDAGGPFGECQPDGVCDGNDAFHALNAFAGQTACTCPAGGPAPDLTPPVVGRAVLSLRTRAAKGTMSELIQVDAYLESSSVAVRGYQLHVQGRGSRRGDVQLVDIHIEDRPDRLFAEPGAWSAFNVETAQMVAGIDGAGVVAGQRRYLATFTYRIATDAAGDFAVELLADHSEPQQRTFIFPDAASGRVEVSAKPALITVRHPRTDRRLD